LPYWFPPGFALATGAGAIAPANAAAAAAVSPAAAARARNFLRLLNPAWYSFTSSANSSFVMMNGPPS
jgi:hypothetical protein